MGDLLKFGQEDDNGVEAWRQWFLKLLEAPETIAVAYVVISEGESGPGSLSLTTNAVKVNESEIVNGMSIIGAVETLKLECVDRFHSG